MIWWFRLWTLQVWHVLSALRQTLSTASMPLKKHNYGACLETKFEAVKSTCTEKKTNVCSDVSMFQIIIWELSQLLISELSDIWCLRRFGELVRWGQTLHWLSLWWWEGPSAGRSNLCRLMGSPKATQRWKFFFQLSVHRFDESQAAELRYIWARKFCEISRKWTCYYNLITWCMFDSDSCS